MRSRSPFIWSNVLAALWLGFALPAPPVLWGAAPTLTRLFPAGSHRGGKVTVTCSGSFAWPVQVHAPGIAVTPSAESGKLEVSVPADLVADRVWLRLYNQEGCSASMPFLIGSLPEVVETEPNHSPRSPQQLDTSRVTINGVLEGADVDGFSISLTAGQTLVAAVDAHDRLGSPMDAILQIVSPDGTVEAENHDDIGLDPRLAFTAPRDGRYIARVFGFSSTPNTNIALQGGADYVYRLTLTTGPFATHTVPSVVSTADTGAVRVLGWNLPAEFRVPVAVVDDRLEDCTEFEAYDDFRNPGSARLGFVTAPELANAVRLRLVPHPVVPELAAGAELGAGNADHPAVLQTPSAITGWIQHQRQTDTYRLPLTKGQAIVVSVETRSLGLPLHPVVKLVDPAGSVAAMVEPPEPQDVVLRHTAAQDGEYRLLVSDRYRLGGPRCLYRLSVRLDEADFSLAASADAIVVTSEKPVELPLVVQRHSAPEGAVGPIMIEAIGLPEGVSAPVVTSEPSGSTAEKVTLVLTTTGVSYSGPIRIVGKAAVPRELQRRAKVPPRLGISFESIWLTSQPVQAK